MPIEKALLRELCVKANNIIMKGSFSGDDITEAANIMKLCHTIFKNLENEQKDNGPSAKES